MSAASFAAYRARLVEDSLSTASPAKLLTMLYDRLVLDLDRAKAAQEAGDRAAAGEQLKHAQDIVLELRSSLRLDVWDGAAGLSALYTYLWTELVKANVTCDPALTQSCRDLVEPLRQAWHEAAALVAAGRGGAVAAHA